MSIKKYIYVFIATVTVVGLMCSPLVVYAQDNDYLELIPDTVEEQEEISKDSELSQQPDKNNVTLSRPKLSYTSTVQRPTVTVENSSGEKLVYKKDFTVSYSDWNSTNVGKYTVTVNYIGDYIGYESETFEYEIIPQTNVTVTLNRTRIYNTGTVQRPLVTVVDKYNRQLVYKQDFTVDYSNWKSKDAGEYTVTVNMIGNYAGTETYSYVILDYVVTLSRTEITYTGTIQRPLVKVKEVSGKELVYKKDFTVDYSNWKSTNAGEYTVTVKYIGNYTGSETYTYKINPQTSVTPVLDRPVIKYTGTVQRPKVTVKDKKGNSLVYKQDFTIDYSDWKSTNVGVYTVTVKMNGNYGGTKKYKYYIDYRSDLPLNTNATHISYEYDNVSKVVYGKSKQGRNLEAFVLTPTNGKYTKTFVATFAIHGFEDCYAHDGKVLTGEANKLVEYYAKYPEKLKNFRIVIIPCLNPDGTIAGKNNYRASKNAFGRCTADHIDMNRDFPGFKASESKALRDFLKSYRPNVFTDFHGWLDESIGTGEMCRIYNKNMGLKGNMSGSFFEGYLYSYINKTYRCPSVLVEYKNPNSVSHNQTVNSINEIISYYS